MFNGSDAHCRCAVLNSMLDWPQRKLRRDGAYRHYKDSELYFSFLCRVFGSIENTQTKILGYVTLMMIPKINYSAKSGGFEKQQLKKLKEPEYEEDIEKFFDQKDSNLCFYCRLMKELLNPSFYTLYFDCQDQVRLRNTKSKRIGSKARIFPKLPVILKEQWVAIREQPIFDDSVNKIDSLSCDFSSELWKSPHINDDKISVENQNQIMLQESTASESSLIPHPELEHHIERYESVSSENGLNSNDDHFLEPNESSRSFQQVLSKFVKRKMTDFFS